MYMIELAFPDLFLIAGIADPSLAEVRQGNLDLLFHISACISLVPRPRPNFTDGAWERGYACILWDLPPQLSLLPSKQWHAHFNSRGTVDLPSVYGIC